MGPGSAKRCHGVSRTRANVLTAPHRVRDTKFRLTLHQDAHDVICPSCQSAAGDFACDVGQIKSNFPRVPLPSRGAFRDRHRRWARDAMAAGHAQDERAIRRTAKSCGPDVSTLTSTGDDACASHRGR